MGWSFGAWKDKSSLGQCRKPVIGFFFMRNDHVCDLHLNIEYSQWLFLNNYQVPWFHMSLDQVSYSVKCLGEAPTRLSKNIRTSMDISAIRDRKKNTIRQNMGYAR